MRRTVLRRWLSALAVISALGVSGAAFAQSGDDNRIDRLEKQVHELRSIVFQARDTGQPVQVKPVGPDPAVTALGARLDAIDDTLRQLNGQIEVLQHDSDAARQAASAVRDENGELRGELKDLTDRVAKLEAANAAAQAAAGPPPPQPPAPGDTGVLGPPPAAPGPGAAPDTVAPPAAPPTAAVPLTAAQAYRRARALLDHGDYPAATAAFQAFVVQHGDSPELSAAYYWLGESDSARLAYSDAVPAYANALKGWPKTPWAPDATVKLSKALAESGQTGQACAALSEFDRRYHGSASSTVKARADSLRTRVNCPG